MTQNSDPKDFGGLTDDGRFVTITARGMSRVTDFLLDEIMTLRRRIAELEGRKRGPEQANYHFDRSSQPDCDPRWTHSPPSEPLYQTQVPKQNYNRNH
jgi:hypothetical protein